MNKGTGTGLGIITLASTVASGLLIFSPTQGVKMLEKGDIGSACFWCGVGVVPVAGAALFWVSMGDQPVWPQRIILLVVGAILGGSLLNGVGEFVRSVKAQSQQGAGDSHVAPETALRTARPQVNITGSGFGNNETAISAGSGVDLNVNTSRFHDNKTAIRRDDEK